MGKKKCPICGKWIESDELSVPYKGRYAHKDCFNNAAKLLTQDKQEKLKEKAAVRMKRGGKAAYELKDAVSEEEHKEKVAFFDYLKNITREEITPKQYKVAEDYINKYKFTYPGMLLTLMYLKEELEKELTGDVIGIIPYYFSDAEKAQERSAKAIEHNKNAEFKKEVKRYKFVSQPYVPETVDLDADLESGD